jgi:23S rRNA (cytosine1962-C5)-methyltransferase
VRELLITPEQLAALAAEQTTAHRLWTGLDGWVERFGDDCLVSAVDDGSGIAGQLSGWLSQLGLHAGRVFVRRLVKQPGEDDKPRQIFGATGDAKAVVLERGLKFGVDFEAGYSAGLFCDQRMNRAHLESLRPRRVLNCFAYTCAFSVSAARAGAETLNLDLSRKSLDRGRENLALNNFSTERHRFIADDVFAVLPRLARRGEKFDAIILDPPTFSRGAKGRVFRAEKDFDALLELALDVAAPGAAILLSTNARELDADALVHIGGGLRCHEVSPPGEYPPGASSTTLWMAAP